jgi:hypothetical protein
VDIKIGYEQYLRERLCVYCHGSITEPFCSVDTSKFWCKCPTCGYTHEDTSPRTEEQKKMSKMK